MMPMRWKGRLLRSGCRRQRASKHTEKVEQLGSVDERGEEASERE